MSTSKNLVFILKWWGVRGTIPTSHYSVGFTDQTVSLTVYHPIKKLPRIDLNDERLCQKQK